MANSILGKAEIIKVLKVSYNLPLANQVRLVSPPYIGGLLTNPTLKSEQKGMKNRGQRTNRTAPPACGYFAFSLNNLAFLAGSSGFQRAFNEIGSRCCYQTVAQGWETQ